MKFLSQIPNITNVVPRLEYMALASSSQQTKGVAVVGVDPVIENNFTHLTKWLIKGTYLQKGDSGVLVAARLAAFLQLKTDDTLVLLGQGYHGVSVAGKFPVRGILNFPSFDLNS